MRLGVRPAALDRPARAARDRGRRPAACRRYPQGDRPARVPGGRGAAGAARHARVAALAGERSRARPLGAAAHAVDAAHRPRRALARHRARARLVRRRRRSGSTSTSCGPSSRRARATATGRPGLPALPGAASRRGGARRAGRSSPASGSATRPSTTTGSSSRAMPWHARSRRCSTASPTRSLRRATTPPRSRRRSGVSQWTRSTSPRTGG